jgi:signal transduction histidine kinase
MPEGGRLTLAASYATSSIPSAEGPSRIVRIAVSDQGIGIDPQDLDGILQPFHGGFARGTGLGLSIVHRIVSDYGGELSVTSQRGSGTTVTVKLPAADDHEPAVAGRRKLAAGT